jgi:hypothetical protein
MHFSKDEATSPKHRRSGAFSWTGFRLRILLAMIGAAGVALLGSGVFAAWSPTASISSGSMGSADLAVTLVDTNGTTFNTAVSNLLPGDYLYRYADLTNTGSVAQTFSGSVTGSGVLAPAMTVKVDTCSVSWSANGSCSGTTSSILTATATNPAANVSFPSMASNAVTHARFQFQLATSASQGTYQGTSATEAVSLAGSATVSGGQDRTAG